eukprot:jgi/Tetstr1/444824/TSEL_032666.t1
MATWIAHGALYLASSLAGAGVSAGVESQVKAQVSSAIDAIFSSKEWDEGARVSDGTVLAAQSCIFNPKVLASALSELGLQPAEEQGPSKLDSLKVKVHWKGLFSTPWEVTAEGLHLVVRTLGESELGKPPDDPSRRAATSPGVSPTADTPQMGTSATSSSSAYTGGAGPQLPTNGIEDASFWEKCFPCLQALENLKLTLRDLTLDIYDGQDPDAGRMLQIKLGKVTGATTSGPPDWREIYQADSANNMRYKILEMQGLSVSCFQTDPSASLRRPSSRQLGKCLVADASGRVLMSKRRKSDSKAVSNFLKAQYTLVLELNSRTLPMMEAKLGLIVEYDEATESWTVSHSGEPLKLSLDHVIPSEDLLEIAAWMNTLTISFASMQPELESRLEATRRGWAMEHARNLSLSGKNAALTELCSQLEVQVLAAKERVSKTADYEAARAQARAKEVEAVRSKLASLLPRSNTAETAAAEDIDRLLAGIAGKEARWAEEVGRSECGGDASGYDGNKPNKFRDFPKQVVRSLTLLTSRPSSAATQASSVAPHVAAEAESCMLVIRKRSWLSETHARDCNINADHLSKAVMWCAIAFAGVEGLHKFPLGQLENVETCTPVPASLLPSMPDAGPRRIELLALWLDLGTEYKLDQRIHGYDFTLALQSISVKSVAKSSAGEQTAADILHGFEHVFSSGVTVWDGRNVIVVDIRAPPARVISEPMHTFTQAGKTKLWQVSWEKNPYVYQDTVIGGNRFNTHGEWVGSGHGCHGGIYRHYKSSVLIEELLAKYRG